MQINFGAVISAIIGVFFTHSLAVRLGPYDISASDTGGAPVHFTPAMIFSAYEALRAGMTGTVQVGDILLTIAPHNAPIATPAPANVLVSLVGQALPAPVQVNTGAAADPANPGAKVVPIASARALTAKLLNPAQAQHQTLQLDVTDGIAQGDKLNITDVLAPETVTVQSVVGNTLTLVSPIEANHAAGIGVTRA